jgi:membrane protein DedA with SNARE-associated domain
VLASLTSPLTSFVGNHGVYAVFALMAVAAVFPAASELVMLYAGALASGAFASQHVVVFGNDVSHHGAAFVAIAAAGVFGNTVGAVAGWLVGSLGGRPLLLRRGRWLHVTEEKLDRAEARFERAGPAAVPLLFATPVLRSFVAIPAGVVRIPLRLFMPLALAGCLFFCFLFAGIGYAAGTSYDRLHGDLRYLDVAVVVLVVAAGAYVVLKRRSSRLPRRARDPAR